MGVTAHGKDGIEPRWGERIRFEPFANAASAAEQTP